VVGFGLIIELGYLPIIEVIKEMDSITCKACLPLLIHIM